LSLPVPVEHRHMSVSVFRTRTVARLDLADWDRVEIQPVHSSRL